MFRFIVCSSFILFSFAYSNSCSAVIDNIVVNGNCKGILKHGKFVGYYDSGMPAWEVNFKYNKLHGKFKRYYPNGGLHFEGRYKDGVLDGKFIQYRQEDGRYLKARFKKGVLHGWLEVYENHSKIDSIKFYYGAIKERLFFYKN